MSDADLEFDAPHLAAAVEKLPVEAVNALPFGAIRLDAEGRVRFYSEAERRLSGFWEAAEGRSFFTEIAPCMNNPRFKGRIERAMAAGTLDLEFGHIGDFVDRTRELQVRVQSASSGGCWIFMRRGE